jgi:hypothetical protein
MCPNFSESDSTVQRLCHEALAWRQFRHPNIPAFLDLRTTAFPKCKLLALLSSWISRNEYSEVHLNLASRCWLLTIRQGDAGQAASPARFAYRHCQSPNGASETDVQVARTTPPSIARTVLEESANLETIKAITGPYTSLGVTRPLPQSCRCCL